MIRCTAVPRCFGNHMKVTDLLCVSLSASLNEDIYHKITVCMYHCHLAEFVVPWVLKLFLHCIFNSTSVLCVRLRVKQGTTTVIANTVAPCLKRIHRWCSSTSFKLQWSLIHVDHVCASLWRWGWSHCLARLWAARSISKRVCSLAPCSCLVSPVVAPCVDRGYASLRLR